MTYLAGAATGAIIGTVISAFIFRDAPPPPLYAFGCAILDYPPAVLMNGDLVCLRDAEIVSDDAILQMVIDRLRAGQGGE